MQRSNLTFDIEEIKININDGFELKYWSNKFKVTRDELRSAVKAVGDSPAKVEIQLKKNAITR